MVRRSRRTTLGDATFALSPPWSLIASWTNSRFLSASSAFAFSVPATRATGQKRGSGRGGRGGEGIVSAAACVSVMTASRWLLVVRKLFAVGMGDASERASRHQSVERRIAALIEDDLIL